MNPTTTQAIPTPRWPKRPFLILRPFKCNRDFFSSCSKTQQQVILMLSSTFSDRMATKSLPTDANPGEGIMSNMNNNNNAFGKQNNSAAFTFGGFGGAASVFDKTINNNNAFGKQNNSAAFTFGGFGGAASEFGKTINNNNASGKQNNSAAFTFGGVGGAASEFGKTINNNNASGKQKNSTAFTFGGVGGAASEFGKMINNNNTSGKQNNSAAFTFGGVGGAANEFSETINNPGGGEREADFADKNFALLSSVDPNDYPIQAALKEKERVPTIPKTKDGKDQVEKDTVLPANEKTNWGSLPAHLHLYCLSYLPLCKDDFVWYGIPDTANESYQGTFVTDVYDSKSTINQFCHPDNLHFAEATYRVLKQIHPNMFIDLGALNVCEDYQRHILKNISEHATKLANVRKSECKCFSKLADGQATASSSEDGFDIVGQNGSTFYVASCSSMNCETCNQVAVSWEPRSLVEKLLPEKFREWETFELQKKTGVFEEWLDKARKENGPDFYPQQIIVKDIRSAANLCLPGELARWGVHEGTKAVTQWTSRDSSLNSNRSSISGLQFDVNQVGLLMSEHTGQNVNVASAVYLSAVIEYMTAEVLELAGNAANDRRSMMKQPSATINPRCIQLAIRNDDELGMFCSKIHIMDAGVLPNIQAVLLPKESNTFKVHRNYVDVYGRECDNSLVYGCLNSVPKCSECGGLTCGFRCQKDGNDSSKFSNMYVGKRSPATILKGALGGVFGKPSLSRGCINEILNEYLNPIYSVQQEEEKQRSRDSIQGLTIHMFQRLAARAGVVQMSGLAYVEMSGLTKNFLTGIIRDTLTYTEQEGMMSVTPEHVLVAAERQGRCLWGTGRLRLNLMGMHRYSNSEFDTEYLKLLNSDHLPWSSVTEFGTKEWRKYHGYDSVEKFKDAKENEKEREEKERKYVHNEDKYVEDELKRKKDAIEDAVSSFLEARDNFLVFGEMPNLGPGPTAEQKEQKELHKDSLQLVRKMQESTERIIPFVVMARLISEIGQNFKEDLKWSPVAINLIDSILEDYLIEIFENSNLNGIHSRRTYIEPKDIQLAWRISGGRLSGY
jgi:histone H2A